MNFFEQAYKQFFFKVLLGLYLVANFSIPIFEGIHFLQHLNDDSQLHSFQSHTDNHAHKTLELFDDLLIDNASNSKPHTSDSEVKIKKTIQFLEEHLDILSITYIDINKNFLPVLTYHKAPFLSTNGPPPDVQSS